MNEGETRSLEGVTCEKLYGPFGCPVLGLVPGDLVEVVVSLEKRQSHEVVVSESFRDRAEKRKAAVCIFLVSVSCGVRVPTISSFGVSGLLPELLS